MLEILHNNNELVACIFTLFDFKTNQESLTNSKHMKENDDDYYYG
jgi:hypothetical protein